MTPSAAGRNGRLPDRSQVRSPLQRSRSGTATGLVHPLPPKPESVPVDGRAMKDSVQRVTSDLTESLKADIYNIRIENSDGKHFVCDDDLRQVLSEGRIKDLLKGCIEPQTRTEVVQAVIGQALKILAILICVGKVDKIKAFIEHDQMQKRALDDLLPLEKPKLRKVLNENVAADDFFEKQWEFTAPSFLGRISPRTLDKHTILPFLKNESLAKGGYGSVFKIDIHPRYRDQKFARGDMFVRKELEFDDKTYKNEVQVLSTLQQMNHPNILRLISCYSHSSKHNLISPFKPDGTLNDFLKAAKPVRFSHTEMLVSVTGLASALWALHMVILDDVFPTYKGQHQDLHHGNILVDENTFILADFGLSRIKPLNSQSRTPVKGLVGFCSAPESMSLEPPYTEHETTRKADVFALGCMFTDLLVHSVRGPTAVADFEEARKFTIGRDTYRRFHKGREPNEAVSQWLKSIAEEQSRASTTDFTRSLMDMLEISPGNRPSAADVTIRLCMITFKAFAEELDIQFAPLKMYPEALNELARFESWLEAQDFSLYSSLVSAPTAMAIFQETVDTLRQISEELQKIQKQIPAIDSRSVTALRALTMKLLSRLTPERLMHARSRHLWILREKAETDEETRETIARIIKDYPIKSQLGRIAHTAQLVAQIHSATKTSRKPSFRTIYGPIRDVNAFDRYHTGKICVDGAERRVVAESIVYPDLIRKDEWLPRLHALCELLSSHTVAQTLRVPPFLGLYDNTRKYCWDLIFDFPRNHDGSISQQHVMSLESILKTKNGNAPPALDFKMRLALKLTELLAAFHDVGWYHKDLRSNSVLFFMGDESSIDYETLEPFLIGFRHSRKVSDELTDGPPRDPTYQRYHHPDYVSISSHQFKGFKSHYDIYSLGVLLFEVGCWTTIDKIVEGHSKLSNDVFREKLIEEGLPALKASMGNLYAEAVRTCLVEFDEFSGQLEQNRTDLASNAKFKQQIQEPLSRQVEFFCSSPIGQKRKRSSTDNNASSPQRRRSSYFDVDHGSSSRHRSTSGSSRGIERRR